jgi:hypothetical protein
VWKYWLATTVKLHEGSRTILIHNSNVHDNMRLLVLTAWLWRLTFGMSCYNSMVESYHSEESCCNPSSGQHKWRQAESPLNQEVFTKLHRHIPEDINLRNKHTSIYNWNEKITSNCTESIWAMSCNEMPVKTKIIIQHCELLTPLAFLFFSPLSFFLFWVHNTHN